MFNWHLKIFLFLFRSLEFYTVHIFSYVTDTHLLQYEIFSEIIQDTYDETARLSIAALKYMGIRNQKLSTEEENV